MMNDDARTELIQKRGYRRDIVGDTLSLYLSNNPKSAMWLGKRVGDKNKIVLELCCAVGVTLEHLAPFFKGAIGVDIDKEVLNACRQNLQKANMLGKVQLILGDVADVNLLKSLTANVVIYDIPYWYPEKYSDFSAEEKSRTNPDLAKLIADIKNFVSKDIIIFAPKEMGYEYFRDILGECECSEIFISGKYDRNYIFIGDLVEVKGSHRVSL